MKSGKQMQPEVVNAVRYKVQQLSAQGQVELELVQEFIRESAYWDHPRDSLVRAPKHAERIYNTPGNNWVLDFGANSFLVCTAIYRCQQVLLELLKKAECGDVMPRSQLREKVEL